MKKLLALVFIVSLFSCAEKYDNKPIEEESKSNFSKRVYKTVKRNGYTIYCFRHFGTVRDMDSIFYTIDSIKINNPPNDFIKTNSEIFVDSILHKFEY
jgi:hypothetical protein